MDRETRTDPQDKPALWPLGALGAGILACSLLPDPWRVGAIAALLVLAGVLVWQLVAGRERLIASLRASVTIDPLTRLLNRAGYEAQMEIELARAAREGAEFAFIVADVDDFKSINDRLGHLGGDMALERVAGRIEETTRAGDIAARLGGDEFAIILPDSGEREALAFAERLVEGMRSSFAGTAADLTVSVGIAIFPAAGRTAESLLDSADRAMYEAKAAGKDRVAVYAAEPPAPRVSRDPLQQVA